MFLGANIDDVETAKNFGIGADRAVRYHSDSKGTELNFHAMSKAISAVRASAPLGSGWKDEIEKDYKGREEK